MVIPTKHSKAMFWNLLILHQNKTWVALFIVRCCLSAFIDEKLLRGNFFGNSFACKKCCCFCFMLYVVCHFSRLCRCSTEDGCDELRIASSPDFEQNKHVFSGPSSRWIDVEIPGLYSTKRPGIHIPILRKGKWLIRLIIQPFCFII